MKCVVFLLLHACLNLGNIKEGGFRPFNFENTMLTYGLGVMAWACTQYCRSEALEQKKGQNPKTKRNEIELSCFHHSICLNKPIILVWSHVKIG